MRFYPENRDNGPIRYIGRVPVYATTVIAALYCVGLLFTVIMEASHGPIYYFTFSTENFFRRGWLWQIITCTFVNGPSFFFPFAIIFFYQFSSELEQFFGRRTFFKFYALLLAAIMLTFGAWRLIGYPGLYSGMNEIIIGIFVGYATLYPNLECFGWVPMKYMAFACIFIDAMNFLGGVGGPDWHGLSVLSAVCGVGFGFIRYVKLGGSVEFGDWARRLNPFRRRPKFRVLPSANRPAPPSSGGGSGSLASVDAILDKIARDGFASLNQDERDQLEKAREILNKKKN